MQICNLLFVFCASVVVFAQSILCGSSNKDKADQKSVSLESSDLITVGHKTWNCREWKACEDKMGFHAVLSLHERLDDDANGNIDISESDDFLRDELNYENSYERQKGFHRNDKQITADELWMSWKSSEVHNWTVEDTVQWLSSNVELPQYAKNFQEKAIDGTALPRLAMNNMHYLSSLGIKDPIHKQKISLKAMDAVLFGPSKNHNYLKDALLTLSLIIATGGCWFAYVQHKRAQCHLRKTMRDMESLQHAEESLQCLQKELDKAKLEQEIVATEKEKLEKRLQNEITTTKHQDSFGSSSDQSRIQQLEEELKVVLEELCAAEKVLQERSWVPQPELQNWLQLTHELELQHYNNKKAAAEQQLAAAKEGCEKLRRKRSGFLGTFRVAHGSSIDDVDTRILQAKGALSEVTRDLQERLHRWRQIEMLCNFSIVHNPGLPHLESLLRNRLSGLAASKSNLSGRLPRTNSEGTLADDDSVSSFPPGVSAIQHLVQNSATLFLTPPLPTSPIGHFLSHALQNYPSAGLPSHDSSFSFPFANYCAAVNEDQQSIDGSLMSIPYYYNQRHGLPLNISDRRVPSPDLKSCSSSSAILQRADAICYEHVDSYSTDGTDCESLEDKINCTAASHPSPESSRPIFVVGDSCKDASIKLTPSSFLTRRFPKLGKSAEQNSDKSNSSSENHGKVVELTQGSATEFSAHGGHGTSTAAKLVLPETVKKTKFT